MKNDVLNSLAIGVVLTGVFACAMAIGYSEGKKEIEAKYASEEPMESPEYQFIITDDSISVTDFNRPVGVVKIEGQLKNLINKDNE